MNSKFFHTNLHELARLVDLAGLQQHANEKGEDSAAVLHVTGKRLEIVGFKEFKITSSSQSLSLISFYHPRHGQSRKSTKPAFTSSKVFQVYNRSIPEVTDDVISHHDKESEAYVTCRVPTAASRRPFLI